MTEKLYITGNFDGGNPKSPDHIIRSGESSFTIIPFSEDNDPNYKFKLDIKLFNTSYDVCSGSLLIDWQVSRFNNLRDYLYMKHSQDSEWVYKPMVAHETQVTGDIAIRPGETYICLHPKYNYQDYLDFIRRISENGIVRLELVGRTDENRVVWLIKCNDQQSELKKRVLIVSRIHPYETSGSFCVEGIVDGLLGLLADYPSRKFENYAFYLLPMANPDGVYNGLCKLSKIAGNDLSKEWNDNDTLSNILKNTIDRIRPHIYCEIHNWMFKDVDGLYFLNRMHSKKISRAIPLQKRFGKTWRIALRKKLFALQLHGFKQYCKEKYKSVCAVFELPWFYRSTKDMRQLGFEIIKALTTL